MTERLLGKRTIVTGAGSGIGKAAARLFAAEGAHVLCADIDGDSAQATAAGISDRAVGMRVDVTEPDDCAAMVERAVAAFGGVIGVPGIASYAAAKAGVIGLARQMAVDYGPDGIRVNAICPGTVPTPLVRATYEKGGGFAAVANVAPGAGIDEMIEASAVRNPLGRLGTTGDIANLALYLASGESSWVSGTAITIDGGMSAA